VGGKSVVARFDGGMLSMRIVRSISLAGVKIPTQATAAASIGLYATQKRICISINPAV